MTDDKSAAGRISLSKDERKQLLAEIERDASRREPPEGLLQRAHGALNAGQIDVAQRLIKVLEVEAPTTPGLDYLKEQMAASFANHKLRERIRTAEEMLTRAIQQRKKPLAQMTLEALREIAPQHPRLDDFTIWVRDLDKEMALHARIDEIVQAGRSALAGDDLVAARRQLDMLRKVDPYGVPVEQLAADIEAVERGRVASADIGRLKQRIDRAIAERNLPEAEAALAILRSTDVPRVTSQTFARRIAEIRQQLDDAAEVKQLNASFEQLLVEKKWHQAREMAQRFGRRFAEDPRSTAMFNRVAEVESSDRRQQSIEQGFSSLEQFIARGQRSEARLALKLLRSMQVDAGRLARLEAQVDALG